MKTLLQCATPYVGDGILCTIDTDGDMYPDEPLETCTAQDNKKFCLKVQKDLMNSPYLSLLNPILYTGQLCGSLQS